jgi:tripeptidyl-peptidase-1
MASPPLAFVFVAVLLLCLTDLPRITAARAARHTRFPKADSSTAAARVHWYTRTAAPAGWSLVEAASPESPVSFTLIVGGSRVDELEERFWRVSDPEDDLFGEWMTHAEIVRFIQPSPPLLSALFDCLSEHGIGESDVANYGDSFVVRTTVASASSLFSTSFHRFRHLPSGRSVVRQWGEFSVPSVLTSQLHLLLVLGVHTFPPLEQRKVQRETAEDLRLRHSQLEAAAPLRPIWVPSAVSDLYGVPHPITPLSTPLSTAGVIEWERESFSASDLLNFSMEAATPLPSVDGHHIIGPNNATRPGGEASLDIQWMEAMNPGSTPWFWLVEPDNGWMYDFAVQFLTSTDYPTVISLSYGVAEMISCSAFGNTSDCAGVVYRTYLYACDRLFMKTGLLGVSVFVASGDAGTTAGFVGRCLSSLDAPQPHRRRPSLRSRQRRP